MSEELNITLPLRSFIDSHLGRQADGSHMWFSRPIDRNIAAIILAKTDNKSLCYIQWADDMSPDLKEPILWEWSAWRDSSERWLRQKKYSEAQRIEREIEKQNVVMVAKAYEQEFGIGGDAAMVQAYKWVRTGNMKAMKIIGITKLLTKDTIR